MKIRFYKGFNGKFKLRGNELNINSKAFLPYDLTMAGLVGCLYSTFLDVLRKRELTVYGCDVDFSYSKRKERPYTLETVDISFSVDSKHTLYELRKALDEAKDHCSMYYTISQVSDINLEIKLKPKLSFNLF